MCVYERQYMLRASKHTSSSPETQGYEEAILTSAATTRRLAYRKYLVFILSHLQSTSSHAVSMLCIYLKYVWKGRALISSFELFSLAP